jgi:hypothetical protein
MLMNIEELPAFQDPIFKTFADKVIGISYIEDFSDEEVNAYLIQLAVDYNTKVTAEIILGISDEGIISALSAFVLHYRYLGKEEKVIEVVFSEKKDFIGGFYELFKN